MIQAISLILIEPDAHYDGDKPEPMVLDDSQMRGGRPSMDLESPGGPFALGMADFAFKGILRLRV